MQIAGVEINPERIPRHIAIIMDGNGRWAQEKGKKRVQGHQKGLQTLKDLIEFNRTLKIPFISVYAFSTENWNRPKEEVTFLMKLGKEFIKNYTEELHKNDVRLWISGTFDHLDPTLIEVIQNSIQKTEQNKGFTFNIVFNYGGRKEIFDAALKMEKAIREGQVLRKDLSEDSFQDYLYHPDLPDVDLLVRSSGEMRISNFLLWQLAYSEIWITNKYWPDFTPEDLCKAISDYQKRNRRFGNVGKK